MNKKLISFLAATAMIVTFSQESMALVGEAINDGNVAIEQEKEPSDTTQDATVEDEVSDSQSTPEGNKAEDTQVSATNAVEVSTWAELNTAITNASNGDTIRINGDIDKTGTDKAIIITGKTIKIVAQNDDSSGIKITRDSEQSTNGEFIIESGAGLTLEGDLTIEAPKYQNGGMLTHANFIKVESGGNLNITDCKITAHTNDGHNNGKQGNSGLILCEGNMIINDSSAKDSKEVKTRISGYTLEKSGGEELAAVVVKGKDATLTMNGGEISGNYNKTQFAKGAAIQVINGANFTMTGGKITKNGMNIDDNEMYGSGIFIKGSKSIFTMDGGSISDNYGSKGVGIYAIDKSELYINSGRIIRNKMPSDNNNHYGGGVYAEDTTLKIGKDRLNNDKSKLVIISENGAERFGEAYNWIQSYGGGIYTKNSDVTITNAEIIENKTSGNNNQGGAGVCFIDSKVVVSNSGIKRNKAGIDSNQSGGGMYIKDSDVNIINTEISENEVSPKALPGNYDFGSGGGIAVFGKKANLTVNDCKIINNKAGANINYKYYTSNGGGIYFEEGVTTIKGNSIISGNEITENGNKRIGEGISINEMDSYDKNEAKLYLEGPVKIDDDIWLGKDRIISVTKELNPKNQIKISSQEADVEDKDIGTKLVKYDTEENALNATLAKQFIPSEHMDSNLKIGQSQKTKDILTYVKELPTGGGGTGGGTVTPNPNPTPTPDPKPEEPDRIEGNDRIETSVETSKDLYPNGTNAVVLANCERYTDVLTADPFAIQEKASALMTYKDKLPEKTLKEIERLGAKKIYISGGYDAVSKKVVDELANRGYEIFRFDGVDRYDTARKIAIKIREKGNTNAAELASGEDFPDALCMTPLAVKDHAPILLTKKDSIPKYTKQALAEWDIENIKIGGLDEAVSTEVEKQLKAGFSIDKNSKEDSKVYDGVKVVKRIGGEDRYETSAKLAAESYPDSKLGVYATGEDFPDALIAGNYAGRKEAPVLLVKGNDLPEPIEKYTKESKIEKATIIGGVNAVSDKVFNLIKAIINR